MRVSRHRFNIRSLLTNSKSFETFKSSVSLGGYEGKTDLRRRVEIKLNLDPVFYPNVAKIVYLLERNIKVTTITFQKGLSRIREEGTEEENQKRLIHRGSVEFY